MFLKVLNPDNYSLTLYALPVLLAGGAIAALGLYVLLRERGSRLGVTFWLFSFCISFWLLAAGSNFASTDESVSAWWIRTLQYAVVWIPTAAVSLALVIVQRRDQYRLLARVFPFFSLVFCLGIATTDLFCKGIRLYSWGYYAQYGILGASFLVFFGAAAVLNLYLFWQEYRASTTERQRKRMKGLLWAFSIGYLGAVDFVATFGIPLYPFGYLPVFCYLGIAAWVIVRFRLVDITPELATKQILETMHGAVIVEDMEGKIRVVNRVAQEMLGYGKAELLGADLASYVAYPAALVEKVRAGERATNHEMVWPGSHGLQFTVSVSASPLFDGRDDSMVGIVSVAHDITERKVMEQRFRQLALYDPLTGLPNRMLFYDRMNQLLALARRNSYVLALLYIDLDCFKEINDTHGHEVGDLLLKEAANRMTSALRKADTVARMGGDEFIGVCGRIAAAPDAGVVAKKMLDTLTRPFQIQGRECLIGASIGISLYPQDGDDLEALVNKADQAMYLVKMQGKGGFRFFSPATAT